MSDTTDILETLRTQLRELELDHVQLAGRIMQARVAIKLLEEAMPRRPGRPRKVHDADAGLPGSAVEIMGDLADG
jgi:hypothetical protein